jgi:hypothetical protein
VSVIRLFSPAGGLGGWLLVALFNPQQNRRQTMHLPSPDDLNAQYEADQIDLETAFRLSLLHLSLLYKLKEVDVLVLNGLLQDVQSIAEELKLERPSAAMCMRLLEWVKQAEAATAAILATEPGETDEDVRP